jgi:uncharacterized alkaline shock family protein YloU
VSFDRPEASRSVRVRVARAALQAALEVPGVLGSDSGSSRGRVTADPDSGPLIGVLVTAQSDGRYAVDLSLVADMVPLPALAEEVRARVRRRVGDEELGDVLGVVNVEFASVVTADEFAAAIAAEQEVEEAILAEELGVAAAIAGEAAEVGARGSGSVTGEARGRVPAPSSAGIAAERERRLAGPAGEATPRGPDAAAALAARQAALATDQAALAAQQAALAAEQAALAGERAALAAESAAPLRSRESEQVAGSAPEGDGERKR